MARFAIAVALAAAIALAGCFRLEPHVVKTQGQPQPQPKAPRAFTPPKPPAAEALRPPRMGQWSDDGLRYHESSETSGLPFLPFPLFRRRTGTVAPQVFEVQPQNPPIIRGR